MAPERRRTMDADIAEIKTSLTKIETLLIGEEGSGLMARVKCLEQRPDKNLERAGIIAGMIGSITAILIAIFKK